MGQAPLEATVYELKRRRCNLCGDVFEAEAREGVGEKKYDETAAAMIGLLRYGSGVPFYRLEGLEAGLGIPLPASTQWEIVAETAELIRRAFEELIRQAAQGEVLYNDDTSMKILALARASPNSVEGEEETSSSREPTGQFTSGIVSTRQRQGIVMFLSGRKHARENFLRVLAERIRCAMPCRISGRSCPRSWKSSWGTVTPMPGVALCISRSKKVRSTPPSSLYSNLWSTCAEACSSNQDAGASRTFPRAGHAICT
jgi:transposase IS66 family protein